MPYYPLSQVKINLYTNGGEFIKAINNEPYKGFYWQTSSGKFFTGKTPNDPYSTEIIRPTIFPEENLNNPNLSQIAMEASVETYSIVSDTFFPTEYPKYDSSLTRAKPLYVPPLVTDQDYKQGYITRYFCKKTNEFLYLEINKDTYDKLINKDVKILYQLYKPFKIKWQIAGDKEKVYNTNKNIIHTLIQNQKMYNFNQYLKENYTQFWKSN